MTVPNLDLKGAIEIMKIIQRKHRIPRVVMALDAGLKTSSLYQIMEYGVLPPPDSENAEKIFAYIAKLKLAHPQEFSPQKVTGK